MSLPASPSTAQHRHQATDLGPVRVAVLTISDTRTPDTDRSGARLRELLAADGHEVAAYEIRRDEPAHIRALVEQWCASGAIDVVLTNGGTGIGPRDGTYEALAGLIERPLPGFGELFRMLSWSEVGPAAMLSRACAGVHGRTLIFSMPGSTNAVEVAATKLILPELAHLVLEMKGRPSRP